MWNTKTDSPSIRRNSSRILQAQGSTGARTRVVNAEVALDGEIATDVDRTTPAIFHVVVALCEVHLCRGLDEGIFFKRKTRPSQGPWALHKELALEACSLREEQRGTEEQRGSSVVENDPWQWEENELSSYQSCYGNRFVEWKYNTLQLNSFLRWMVAFFFFHAKDFCTVKDHEIHSEQRNVQWIHVDTANTKNTFACLELSQRR